MGSKSTSALPPHHSDVLQRGRRRQKDVSRSTAELAESALDWMPFLQLLDVCVWERKADS